MFFSIYKSCINAAFARASAYRLNFLLSLVITLGFNLLFPLVTVLIYSAGAGFPGWGFYEVLLMQAVFTLSNGLAGVVFSGVLWATMQHVREGTFEIVLLKPTGPLFFLIATNFDEDSLGLLVGGGALFAVAVVFADVSVAAVPAFLVLFAAGFCVMAGVNMLMAATSFKWVGNSRIPEIFDSLLNFGKYPLTIFPNAIRGLATFVIPVGMIAFYPANALLGNWDWRTLFVVVPSILFMLFGVRTYQKMVRAYEGVGG
ncbi:MAG: ABC-2 family transporter protein [Defluviitaleaceae bacterium]|nr:ABC-2 family transporter protein [Defluviitaleaceae bacterium]MCL2262135.1 ABC-2 family transporter protein [Defluviitaleaceae bacterium]